MPYIDQTQSKVLKTKEPSDEVHSDQLPGHWAPQRRQESFWKDTWKEFITVFLLLQIYLADRIKKLVGISET